MRKALLETLKGAVKTGSFTLTSGLTSDFYIDVKSLLFNASFLAMLSYELTNEVYRLYGNSICAVGGMEMGSIPLSTAIVIESTRHEIPYNHFVIRKTQREHGTKSNIEGFENINKGRPVLLVDDVLTTGGSLVKCQKILAERGIVVEGAIVIVDREEAPTLPFVINSLFTKTMLRS